MKNTIKHFFLILLIGLTASLTACAFAKNSASSVQNISLFIAPAGNANQPLVSWNADTPRSPASTIKILTSVAAYELLGKDYRWKTLAFTHGDRRHNTLYGDLIIQGRGDPSLVPELLEPFVQKLLSGDIKKIEGDLVLDGHYFSDNAHAEIFVDSTPYRPYHAAPSALLYAFNALSFHFVPDLEAGRVQVSVLPRLSQQPVETC